MPDGYVKQRIHPSKPDREGDGLLVGPRNFGKRVVGPDIVLGNEYDVSCIYIPRQELWTCDIVLPKSKNNGGDGVRLPEPTPATIQPRDNS